MLGVPLIMASITQLPMAADRPVESLALSTDADRMVLFFGYVDCPDVCPTTMSAVREAYERYPADAGGPRFGVTFVNLTEAGEGVAAAYARHFHPTFEGLQASGEDRRALLQELGVRFQRSANGPGGWHTDSVYLLKRVGAQWRLRTVVRRRPLEPAQLVALLQEL